jgi:hypothetical protein
MMFLYCSTIPAYAGRGNTEVRMAVAQGERIAGFIPDQALATPSGGGPSRSSMMPKCHDETLATAWWAVMP